MTFESLLKQYLEEEKENTNSYEPWCIEITKNTEKSTLHNLLGEIIIKLSEIRSRID